jgi:tetratricopeptide (TPR) repeat protein
MSYSLGIAPLEERQHAVEIADPAIRDLARMRYDQATERFRAGDFEGAIRLFNEAWGLVPAAAVLVAIGVTLERLGRFQEAAYRLQRYLRENPDGDRRTFAQEELAATQVAMEQQARAAAAPAPPRPLEVPAATYVKKEAEVGSPQQVAQQAPSPATIANPYAEQASVAVWIATGVGVLGLVGAGIWLVRRSKRVKANRRRRR